MPAADDAKLDAPVLLAATEGRFHEWPRLAEADRGEPLRRDPGPQKLRADCGRASLRERLVVALAPEVVGVPFDRDELEIRVRREFEWGKARS